MKYSTSGCTQWAAYAAIVGGCLSVHGWVLVTDYRLWDGWEYSLWLGNHEQLRFLFRLFSEIGRPLDGLYFGPFAGVADPHLIAKFAGVTAWMAHGLFMYACLRRVTLLGSALAFAVSMLVVTCPFFRPLGELSLWMNTCAAMLFWLAAYLFVKMMEMQGQPWRVGLRLAGLAVLFVALNLNSLLVFFYGLAVVLVFRRVRQNGLRRSLSETLAHALRYPDILLLPVIFWLWKAWFTPTHGAYVNYNRPSLDPSMWAHGYLVIATHFLFPFVVEPFSRPGVIAVGGVFAVIVMSRLRTWPAFRERFGVEKLPVGPAFCAAAGVLLLLAASFPYVCVGQLLADDPWLARNNILTPLPMALLVVAAAVWVATKLAPNWLFAWFGICLLICCAWGASAVIGYVRLQAFGVKQMAIRAHLREFIQERSPAVIQFRDYVTMRGGIAYYPPLIWTTMAACCDQMPRTLVFDSRIAVPDQQVRGADGATQIVMGTLQLSGNDVDRIIEETTTPYALTGIPRHGRQILLAALPSATMTNPDHVALEYLRQRWLTPSTGDEWVKKSIEVKAIELEPIRADALAR
jgi:hypothetical protein